MIRNVDFWVKDVFENIGEQIVINKNKSYMTLVQFKSVWYSVFQIKVISSLINS